MQISADVPSQTASPFFSVIILCWNSQPYLHTCLQALGRQTFTDFEIILVDNGSPQPVSQDDLQQSSGLLLRFYRLEQNLGFAGGNNFAAKQASGQYLVLLNSDAYPQPDWLKVIHQATLRHPHCSFASQLIMANSPQRLDGEGDNYHASGLVWRKSYGQSRLHAVKTEREVFSACGAAAVYPRQAFNLVQGFDEDYFAYVEDIDLGFRLRLAGYPCIYLPTAVVHHVGSGSSGKHSDLSVYYGQRNLVWTFFKDMPAPMIWLLLLFHVLTNFFVILLSFLRGQGRVTLKAKGDAIASLGDIFKKRKEIQKQRKTSLRSLVKIIDWNPVAPLLKLIRR